MNTVQLVLAGRKGAATDLTLSRSADGATLHVFLGLALLECVPADPGSPAYRLLLARLVNAEFGVTALARLFGHDERTLRHWAGALASGDPDRLAAALAGRACCEKVTGAIGRFVKMQYRLLRGRQRDYRRTIIAQVRAVFSETVSRETVRRLFRLADQEDAAGFGMSRAGSAPGSELSLRGAQEAVGAAPGPDSCCPVCAAVEPGKDNRSPGDPADARPDALPWDGTAAGPCVRAVHHAGLVLFALWMDVVRAGREAVCALQTQLISQVLQGAVNFEQAGRLSAGDMTWFTAGIVETVKRQRDLLGQASVPATVLDIYRANTRLLPDGPGMARIFYFDTHVKEYTGGLKILKGWCGRRHLPTKALFIDMIHTVSGFPCFAQHFDPYYDLRERVFITLALFDLLFPATERQGRTFVMDRGIYGLEALLRFLRRADHILTWEKGYARDGWRAGLACVSFELFRRRNGPADARACQFEVQESTWHRDPRFRRIIVRATNPKGNSIEVSILCSNPAMPAPQAVELMFSRWVQENGFKELDRHFGLMQITSYRAHSYKDIARQLRDRPVECPEYRELKQTAREAQKTLAMLLLAEDRDQRELQPLTAQEHDLRQRVDELSAQLARLLAVLRDGRVPYTWQHDTEVDRALRACRAAAGELAKLRRRTDTIRQRIQRRAPELEQARTRLTELEQRLEEALRTQSRLQLLIDGCYHRLDMRQKAAFDALRIMAATMFRLLLGAFRPIYGNYRNDVALLRQLTRADGFLVNVQGVARIGLWLKGTYQPRQLNAFGQFLRGMTRAINAQFSGRRIPIELRLIGSPEELLSEWAQPPTGAPVVIAPSSGD